MVAVVVCAELRAQLEAAGRGGAIEVGERVSTAPHGAVLAAGASLRGREVHLCHADAAAAHAPAPPRCAEVEARVRALRARLEEARYARIVADVARGASSSSAGGAAADAVRQLRETGPQLSVAANVVVTMATCFAAAYFVAKASTGSQPAALAAGVLGLIAALGVESVLVLTRMYAIDKAADKAQRSRERKVVRSCGATAGKGKVD